MNPSHKPSLLKLILLFLVLLLGSLACTSEVTIFPTPTIPTLAPWTPPPTEEPQPPAGEATAEPVEPTEAAPPSELAPEALFFDDFSNPDSGWDIYEDEVTAKGYSENEYFIRVNKAERFSWANPGGNFGDVIVEVFAKPDSDEEDFQYGIICRHQDVDHWYALIISPDGYAVIRKKVIENDLTKITDLTDWTEAPAVIQGNETNLLRAECVGDRLTLYVNGVQTLEVFDSEYTTGDVGLATGTITNMNAEVQFDDFTVTHP
jgi:hypothetical protein